MTTIYKVALLVSMTLLFLTSPGLKETTPAEPQKNANRLIGTESASGKIIAIQDDTFTIEIHFVKPPGESFQRDDQPSSMTFLTNSSTKIDGKLEIGSNGEVLYRQQDGNNVAVTVHVTDVS